MNLLICFWCCKRSSWGLCLLQKYFRKWRCPPIIAWLCWSWMASVLAQQHMKPRNRSCKLNWVRLRPRHISWQAIASPWRALMTLQRYVKVGVGGRELWQKLPSRGFCLDLRRSLLGQTMYEENTKCKLNSAQSWFVFMLITSLLPAKCCASCACYWSFWFLLTSAEIKKVEVEISMLGIKTTWK